MKMSHALACALLVQGCSSSSNNPTQGEDGGAEGGAPEASVATSEAGASDAGNGGMDSSAPDSAADAGGDALADDGACPGDWLDTTSLDPSIVPDAGSVILHAAGSGTQNYECEAVTTDGAVSYAWVFVGPRANLDDCHATLIGQHFASEAGAAAPEWQTLDGTYVIGSKKVAFTPDGGAGSVPWLLLQATSHGGTGTLSNADWVSRAHTDGGIAPTSTCDGTTVGATQNVGYSADYYFWGP